MTVAVCHVMPQQLDMWSAIQAQADDGATKPAPTPVPAKASYPTRTVRRSMSNESLDLCTESLGSETGTRSDFLDQAAVMACLYPTTVDDDASDAILPPPAALHDEEGHDVQEEEEETAAGELTEVRYHRARPQRAFPPPLASMSRRPGDDEGPCLRMRPHRRDGRLVVEAVAARPQGYLHARRQDGRLRLCFVDCSSARGDHQKQSAMVQQPQRQEEVVKEEEEHHEVIEEEEEEEDEVEVVDRGTVVEVVAASGKAQRCSRIVINKFVGGAPDVTPSRCSSRASASEDDEVSPPTPGLRRVPSSTTTLAAAVAAASTAMDEEEENGGQGGEEEQSATTTTMLFTSRVGDRAELVQSVRRCRQLRQRPLFIVEPYTIIAT